jgi:hypothetical protein
MSNPYRSPQDSKIKDDQYRIGPTGLIKVHHAKEKVHDTTIYYDSKHSELIYAVTIIMHKEKEKEKGWTISSTSNCWQYHTGSSILEKYPKVLPDNWLEMLM